MSGETYELIDSGDGRKLERLGDVVVDRQAPAAFWKKRRPLDEWNRARGRHVRTKKGGGFWEWQVEPPPEWPISFGDITFLIKPTPFGHAGLFPEQLDQWNWLAETVARVRGALGRQPRVLNLFAYTGGSTLACARAGAHVTHVDAARGVVDWARKNAAANDLPRDSVRWIVDDCHQFVSREVRRDAVYDMVILDPPTFGRGNKNEIWKIEVGLPDLLNVVGRVVDRSPHAVLLTCHSAGFSPVTLSNMLADAMETAGLESEGGEMTVAESTGRELPAGVFLRVRAPFQD